MLFIICTEILNFTVLLSGNSTLKDRSTTQEAMVSEKERDGKLIRSCKYCDPHYSRMISLEREIYCFGIWLHALKYSGLNWSFQTKYPEWADVFESILSKQWFEPKINA